jgi:hypothetical protein
LRIGLCVAGYLILTQGGIAEQLFCPPPQFEGTTADNKWQNDYLGPMREVAVTRQHFPDQLVETDIRCSRLLGSVTGWFSKSCRLIAGEGSLSVGAQSTISDGTICKFTTTLETTNERQCKIECD